MLNLFSHKKVGGIHFCRIARFGFNYYVTRKPVPFDTFITPPRVRSVLMSDGSRRFLRC